MAGIVGQIRRAAAPDPETRWGTVVDRGPSSGWWRVKIGNRTVTAYADVSLDIGQDVVVGQGGGGPVVLVAGRSRATHYRKVEVEG